MRNCCRRRCTPRILAAVLIPCGISSDKWRRRPGDSQALCSGGLYTAIDHRRNTDSALKCAAKKPQAGLRV